MGKGKTAAQVAHAAVLACNETRITNSNWLREWELSGSPKIVLKIKDNGIGMSKKVQNKIFEKFYREQTGDLHNIKGHGLGLAYVKKIIDYHNGKIALESALNKGTVFSIELFANK